MTEQPPETASPKSAEPKFNQLFLDLGPVVIFVVTYNVLQRIRPDDAIYWSTGVFIVATLIAIIFCKLRTGKIPPVLIVTGVLVTAFGGLTLMLRNPTYIQIKPTFVYIFYAVAIVISVLIKQNVWRLMFRHIFTLPDRIWDVLAWRWAGFFLLLAILNEVIRRTQTMDFWVNSRLLIIFPLFFVFAAINAPLTLKHSQQNDEEAAKS